MIFFELLTKKIGFSRICRFPKSKALRKHLITPHLLIPINKLLMKRFDFIEEFDDYDTFIISDEKYLKKGFLLEKFKNSGLLYAHTGILENFQEILKKNLTVFKEYNIFAIIPFNIPTTAISKEFAKREIENYLHLSSNILEEYPDLNIGLTLRVFDYPELIDLYLPIIQKYEKLRVLNLADLFNNLNNYRGIIKAIVKIKQDLDNNKALLASGRIIPKLYPMLVYLGIDIIDGSYLLYLSSENFYDTIEYLLPIYKMKNLPCSCIACRGKLKYLLEEKYSSEKIVLLCLHNLITAKNYMNKIKQYLNYEDYRAFVEKSALDDTYLISMLKILDKNYFDNLRLETPISQKVKQIKCLGPSSYYRPDFQEFRERMIKNFEPEPWTKLIILLPCSAKKPYSESKSHKKFLSVLRKFPEFPCFQEIIITSPLGAIPRQFENIYPVNSYDISVTGEWDENEREIAGKMLAAILNKYNKNIPVIIHLDDPYNDILNIASQLSTQTFYHPKIYEKLTNESSLKILEDHIRENANLFTTNESQQKNKKYSKTWTRKFLKILDYQFGIGCGIKILPNGVNIKRELRNSQIILIDPIEKDKLGVFQFTSGQIALTIAGAMRLAPFTNNSNIIVFDGDKIRGTTLFRPGILEYDSNLLPNDYLIIIEKSRNSIIGMAQLIVGSNFIKNSKTGRIAKVYERI